MGFALWIDGDTAWAQGTHEYRPMGVAVIGVRGVFTARDFTRMRRPLARYDRRFTGHFASLGQMNDFLAGFRTRSHEHQKKVQLRKSLAAPYF